ncbi:MAG: hypothetical protein QXL47_03470 [Candidatus Anstonellales archaeon]
MAKTSTARMIRNLMEKKNGYELFVALEKRLNLREMRFNSKKLDPDGIGALADAYEKVLNKPKATLLRDFIDYLSVRAENGMGIAKHNLDCDMFCEFLESYIIANDTERIELLQDVYKDGGPFKDAIDAYYKKAAADDQTPLLDYVYERAVITKDPELLRLAYQLHKEASEYDGWDKNVRMLLLGAMLSEVGE